MVLGSEDDTAVLALASEFMEYWRVRERLGYQAADAYADTLKDPDLLPQRRKRAKQADAAATPSSTSSARCALTGIADPILAMGFAGKRRTGRGAREVWARPTRNSRVVASRWPPPRSPPQYCVR
ncbi:hypothetical protein DIPPA_17983 [Diplonema papillatum]|nr:hypothetical protein DIPPA_17983 [Diplonema papillatum]